MEIVIIYPVLTKKVTNITNLCITPSAGRTSLSVCVWTPRVDWFSTWREGKARGPWRSLCLMAIWCWWSTAERGRPAYAAKRSTTTACGTRFVCGWVMIVDIHLWLFFLILSMNWCRCLWEWRLTGPLWQWTASTPRTRGWRAEGRVCLALLSISVDFPQTTAQLW